MDIRIAVVILCLYFLIGVVVDMLISGKDKDRNPTIIIFWPIFVLTMLLALILMMLVALVSVIKDKMKK